MTRPSLIVSPSTSDPFTWIEDAIAFDPDAAVLETTDGAILSYAELDRRARAFASALAAIGVAPGDRVLVQVEKSLEAILLYLACLRLGAIFVPLNTGYTDAELGYFIADSEPRLLVVDPARQADLRRLAAGRADVATLSAGGDGTLAVRAASPTPALPRFAADADTLAAFLYTSGTTGRPKGAMLTRGNLASNAATLAAAWHFTRDDVLIHALPLFHAHGLFVAVNTVLAAGASMLLMPRFDASEVLRLMPRATLFMGVPTYYVRLLEEAGLTRAATAGMRLFVSGSAPLLAETHREFEARSGHAILERYGMTETLMNSSNPYHGARIAGTVGPPLPGIEMRISAPETGEPLPNGEIGMIEVRGPNLFKGYWRNPEKTAADMRADGFFVTGDLGLIDEAGYFHIVGRGKDLIISGGYNVYPKEVEIELDAIGSIAESAVIGVPHADFGEAVVAVLVPEAGMAIDEAAVRATLAARLAKYKQPKAYAVYERLPRNAMGKVMKQQLRDELSGLF